VSQFWHTEPIKDLGQVPTRYPEVFKYALYPAAIYSNGTEWGGEKSPIKPFGRTKMEEMLAWCQTNCKDQMTYSEKFGSFHFSNERPLAVSPILFRRRYAGAGSLQRGLRFYEGSQAVLEIAAEQQSDQHKRPADRPEKSHPQEVVPDLEQVDRLLAGHSESVSECCHQAGDDEAESADDGVNDEKAHEPISIQNNKCAIAPSHRPMERG
jgi:hypothetical protein